MRTVSPEEARRIAVRAQLLDGSANEPPRHGPHARLPPDRRDLDGRDAAGARALEQARLLRHRRARPPALGREEALRVQARTSVRSRTSRSCARACGARARSTKYQHERWGNEFLSRNARLQALRPARARPQRADAVTRPRGPLRRRARVAPLVRHAKRRDHARAPPRARRDRRRRPAGEPTTMGSRRALVPGDRNDSIARRGADPRPKSGSARSASG